MISQPFGVQIGHQLYVYYINISKLIERVVANQLSHQMTEHSLNKIFQSAYKNKKKQNNKTA